MRRTAHHALASAPIRDTLEFAPESGAAPWGISMPDRLLASCVLAGALALAAPAAAAPCYNLAAGQPHMLSGRLDYVIYPGPPNFEDVQKGDTPEPNFVLRLAQPICLQGDEFADPKTYFSNVQVVETKAVSGQLRHLLNRHVTLALTQQMAAETGHHHEPLVAWVTAATLTSAPPRPMEFTDEYGTAATTIWAFYASLGDGQGGPASQMIVPESAACRHSRPPASRISTAVSASRSR